MTSTDSKDVDLSVEMAALDTEQGDKLEVTDGPVPAASMGTAYDQRDMQVMGKLQELRVRSILFTIRCVQETNGAAAKLPLYFNPRLCLHTHEYMGACPRVYCFFSYEWRVCRLDLDFCHCCSRIQLRICVFVRDGFDVSAQHLQLIHDLTLFQGTYVGRTISLGLRIRS